MAHSFWVICRNVSRSFVELFMEKPYWWTVLVHRYGRWKSTKTYGVHFFYKTLSFHLIASIRAHKYLKSLSCWKSRRETFFNKTAFLWKLWSSNCSIFEMKHASGLETCAKIYFFIYLQPSVRKNSQNRAILTSPFDDVTVKTINPSFHCVPFICRSMHKLSAILLAKKN